MFFKQIEEQRSFLASRQDPCEDLRIIKEGDDSLVGLTVSIASIVSCRPLWCHMQQRSARRYYAVEVKTAEMPAKSLRGPCGGAKTNRNSGRMPLDGLYPPIVCSFHFSRYL